MPLIEGYSVTGTLYTSERSRIYRARRISDGMPVVLKTLVAEFPSLDEVARLRREYRLTRQVAVEGVMGTFAFERLDTGFAIVLEDCGGECLARIFGEDAGGVQPARHRRNVALYFAGSYGADEPRYRLPDRLLFSWRHALPPAHGPIAFHLHGSR
jgi:hypothetical protein